MRRIQWVSDPAPSALGAVAAVAGPRLLPAPDPRLTPRDELIFLLHTAAEIEHALMAQYLYAAWSIPRDVPGDAAMQARMRQWRDTILLVAKQEMGHLMTVQNVLRSLGAPLNLDREDYPFRSEFYPFPFRLAPVSKSSLARYVIAEMPEALDAAELQQLEQDAQMDVGMTAFNRVGLLYEHIIKRVTGDLTDADFYVFNHDYQGAASDWGRAGQEIFVRTVGTKNEALDALMQIATQGEGAGAVPPPGDTSTHFGKFREMYRAWTGTEPILPLPVNPNIDPQPSSDAATEAGRIHHPVSRRLGQLFDHQYRILLYCLAHHLHTKPVDAAMPARKTGRSELVDYAVDKMLMLSPLAAALGKLPLKRPATGAVAGPPFETPYTVAFPQEPFEWWLWHRDLERNVLQQVQDCQVELAAATDLSAAQIALVNSQLTASQNAANQRLPEIEQFITNYLAPEDADLVQNILEVRIFPPLGLARFGSSPEPMDNYEFGPIGANGYRALQPAETLTVNPATGSLSAATPTGKVHFRDATGRIRPVCPFFEVWARFAEGGDFQPLTTKHLTTLGLSVSDVQWNVRAANLKVLRRTGVGADAINASTGDFSDHQEHRLTATAGNFKPGKSISLGAVRFILPNDQFPEIRLRYVPSAGQVYGPNPPATDPNVRDDVYNAAQGTWDGHRDSLTNPAIPFETIPQSIFAQATTGGQNNGVSLGYLDDACDGVITVTVPSRPGGALCRAKARFSSGPPHFAPDSLPVRALSDDLLQMIEGPAPDLPVAKAEVIDIVRRALETMRLMQTETLNTEYADGAFPAASVAYGRVVQVHSGLLQELDGLDAPTGSQARDRAVGALRTMLERLRRFDQVGDDTPAGRQRMPALMRGPDGNDLALSRRQISLLEMALAQATGGGSTPESDMLALIGFLGASQANVNRHSGVPTPDGGTLAQLFANPPALLLHLRTQNATTNNPPGIENAPLVVPGDPAASAFFRIINTVDHPMNIPFSRVVPGIHKTGVEIADTWIRSLT